MSFPVAPPGKVATASEMDDLIAPPIDPMVLESWRIRVTATK